MKTRTLKIGIQSLTLLGLSMFALAAHAQTTTMPTLFTHSQQPAHSEAATTSTASSTRLTTQNSPATTTPAATSTSTAPTSTSPIVEETPPPVETPEKPEPKPVVKPLVPEEKEEEIATSTPILPISGIAGIFSGPTQFTGIYATEGPLSRETTRTLLQIAFVSALLGLLLVEKRMLERTGAVFVRIYSRLPISGRRIRKA